ncbi:MAG: argD 2 [Planctomycetota bacterium]|nr:argD 2 [Planctomycetota bacterium]
MLSPPFLPSSYRSLPPVTQTASPSTAETIAQFDQYVIGNYRRYPVCLVRGEGSLIWDAEGTRYLDFFPGWGCNLVGHCPPRVVEAVREQIGLLIHVPNTWYTEAQGQFAQMLSERSFGGKAFFCNSGAEANEAAIKLARAHGHAAGRTKIVTMEGGFHGRTYAALTATAQPKYHHGFEPMVPGFQYIRHNDLAAADAAVDEGTAAVLVEPIQGEGGVRLPGPGYLEGLRKLCDERGALLILDEVQTGLGRTGTWFAYQNFAIEPDILTCAKALAGGVAAGVMMATNEVAETLKPGMHASTFGGNPIACRAGIATIETIEEDGLLERGKAIGERFRGHFERFREEMPTLVRDIRIMGVMIGMELSEDASAVVAGCLEKRLLINATHGTVIRLLPALNITDAQIDEGCAILGDVLRGLPS